MENIDLSIFNDRKILVIGDVMLDHYVFGTVERISPEAPVPVMKVDREEEYPGGAANVARNINSLGGKATLIGITGTGSRAEALRECCDDEGLRTHFITCNHPTITKMRFIAQNQQLLRSDWESSADHAYSNDKAIIPAIREEARNSELVIISDYAKGAITQAVVAELKKLDIKVIVDPKPSQKELYKGFFLMTPNHKEASEISSCERNEHPPINAAKHIVENYTQNAIVTCGANGMYIHSESGKTESLPVKATQVYDVSGAGDTVIATIGLAQAAGLNLHECANLANHAAGIVVGKLGTQTATQKELKKSLKE
jgi:D-beta-D-heptose 7-phosphate kinase/D-beta-D-heptose 1-phosphate adenosyltransferase